MKYVLIVMYLALGPDGDFQHTQFEMEFPNRERCVAAIKETEAKVLSRVETRALSLECRPLTPWDEPLSWNAYMEDGVFVASE